MKYYFFIFFLTIHSLIIPNPPDLNKKALRTNVEKLKDSIKNSISAKRHIAKDVYDTETAYSIVITINENPSTIKCARLKTKKETFYYIKINDTLESLNRKVSKEIYTFVENNHKTQNLSLLNQINFKKLKNWIQGNIGFGVKEEIHDTKKSYSTSIAIADKLKTVTATKFNARKTYYYSLTINNINIFDEECSRKAYQLLKKTHKKEKAQIVEVKAFAIKSMQRSLKIISGNTLPK